jgi:uncharacterized DUF497 family protein
MEFEWDEDKRREVAAARGVDLLEAALIFEGPVLTRLDTRNDYGEQRRISIGVANGSHFVVVSTMRGEVVRLITAWKAGRNDRRKYQARIAGGASANER